MCVCVCKKGIEDKKAGGTSEGICGQACLEGEEREHCMQKLMLEEREHMHEGLTPLCIPKPLQMKVQPLQKFAALAARASPSYLQHISVSLATQPACADLAKPLRGCWEQHPCPPQFGGGDCGTSS